MTEQVRVAGFGVPPVPAGAEVTEHSRNQPPNPANAVPGFVPPAPAPAAQPAAQPAPAAAPAVDPTIAALLAALGQAPTSAPAAAPAHAAAPAYVPNGGDPVVASLSGILSGSGVDVSKALAKAIEYNDASLIDKAYIASVGGANAAHLTQLAEQLLAHTGRESEAAEQSCYTLAGGRANFHSAVAVWNQTAPAHLKTIVESLMDSGVRTQSDAGAKMIIEFAKANGGVIQPAGLVHPGASRPGAEAALSKDQFQAEMQKLDRNAPGYEQKRGELYGRRSMGKQLGR